MTPTALYLLHCAYSTVPTTLHWTYYIALYLLHFTVPTTLHCTYYISLYLLHCTVPTTLHCTYYIKFTLAVLFALYLWRGTYDVALCLLATWHLLQCSYHSATTTVRLLHCTTLRLLHFTGGFYALHYAYRDHDLCHRYLLNLYLHSLM